MTTNIINVFVGAEVSDPGEQQLVHRLQRDLAAKRVPATLYANFFPRARRTGQVDLFVRTPFRTAHVEVKSLNREYPVFGRANGPWEQLLPDCSRRSLGKNAGLQALDGTFAISDSMRDLARSGVVRERDFKRHIDTLVAMWQVVPPGSDIQTPPHVRVVSYAELLERLTSPGPGVDWTDEEWDSFARHANLFQPEVESPAARRRRSAEDAITDYRLRARASFSAELKPLVDLGAVGAHGRVTHVDIDQMVASGAVVALTGQAGSGKSFAARHLAVGHCDAGRLVIWLRGGEYDKGRFSSLVARGMAPFSAEQWTSVARPAGDVGIGITVVLDGLNECPIELRSELIDQLQAFILRYKAGVIVTSTDEFGLADAIGAAVLGIGEPNDDARLEILGVHGSARPNRVSAQFRTPYELSIAAECENEIGNDSSVADLHAAYIRRFAPTEKLRSGLCFLAGHLHSKLRSSVPLREALTVLNSDSCGLSPDQVDDLLDCRLLDVARQRVQFRHDLLGHFLAAEQLVREAKSGADLGRLLSAPANKILANPAVAIEADAHRTCEALEVLADPGLLCAALQGDNGQDVAQLVGERVRDILKRGIAVTEAGSVTLHIDTLFGHWELDTPWTRSQRALLAVAGRALWQGLFIDEVCELIDRTDAVCLQHAHVCNVDGVESISAVVAATYSQAQPADGQSLAASYVVAAFEFAAVSAGFAPIRPASGLASRFATTTDEYPWGRLYLAVVTADPSDPGDQVAFADLLRRCLDAGGYHLRLRALRTAQYFGNIEEPYRSEVLEVISNFQTGNWALQSSVVEALSSFGEIDSGVTAEDLRLEIRHLLARSEDSEARRTAEAIVLRQFEDENIVGPYSEAIAGLDDNELVRLLTMAANGIDLEASMFADWTLERLSELVPTGHVDLDDAVKAALRRFLTGPPAEAMMPADATAACLAAIRGGAKFDNALPPKPADLSNEEHSWLVIAGLLLQLESGEVMRDAAEAWRQLQTDRPTTILILSALEGAAFRMPFGDRRPLVHQLYETYELEMRALFAWALDHLGSIPEHQIRRRGGPDHFVIRMLGSVGDLATVERLKLHTLDPDVGDTAVAAIRQIHQRLYT